MVRVFWTPEGRDGAIVEVEPSRHLDVYRTWDGFISPDGDYYGTKPTGEFEWLGVDDRHEAFAEMQVAHLIENRQTLPPIRFQSKKDALVYGMGWVACTFQVVAKKSVDDILKNPNVFVPSGVRGLPKMTNRQFATLLEIYLARGFSEEQCLKQVEYAETIDPHTQAYEEVIKVPTPHAKPARVISIPNGWNHLKLTVEEASPEVEANLQPGIALVKVVVAHPKQERVVKIIPNTLTAIRELVGSDNLCFEPLSYSGLGVFCDMDARDVWVPIDSREENGLLVFSYAPAARPGNHYSYTKVQKEATLYYGGKHLRGTCVYVRALSPYPGRSVIPNTFFSLTNDDLTRIYNGKC